MWKKWNNARRGEGRERENESMANGGEKKKARTTGGIVEWQCGRGQDVGENGENASRQEKVGGIGWNRKRRRIDGEENEEEVAEVEE